MKDKMQFLNSKESLSTMPLDTQIKSMEHQYEVNIKETRLIIDDMITSSQDSNNKIKFHE